MERDHNRKGERISYEIVVAYFKNSPEDNQEIY